MSSRDPFKRAVRRGQSRLGRTLTLVNRTAQTDVNGDIIRDDSGYQTPKWGSETTTDVNGQLVYRGTPTFDRRADGVDEEIDVIAFVPDDQSANITAGEDDDATKATRIEVDGERYAVRQTFDEDNGLIRAHGEQEES